MKIKKIFLRIADVIRKYRKTGKEKVLSMRKTGDWWPAVETVAIVIFAAIIGAELYAQRLEAKIGQMMMVGFRGTAATGNSYIAKAITDLNLGGVILFDYDAPSKSRSRNITGSEQAKKLVSDLKGFARNEPLLVAVDAEGGIVNRLKPSMGFIPVPSAKEAGGGDANRAMESYWSLARELSEIGFNVNFAPVVDVDVNPENPVIGGLERSFSGDPQKVIAFARTFIAAHRSFGVLTAVKHFPGHGSSSGDSHLGLADVSGTYREDELLPYGQLIKDGAVDSVMTAHIVNRGIDGDYPATLSKKFIDGILRERLRFDGVVFSDDMQMGAIEQNYGFEEAVIRAVNAGCDVLIFSNNGAVYDESVPYRAQKIIAKAVRDGRIPESRINQSYERIMKLKGKLKNPD